MQFHLDTATINDLDRKLIAVLHEHFGGESTPAPKAAAKPASAPKVEKAPVAEKAPEPEAPAAEPVAEDPAAQGDATMEDAVERATKLVSSGKAAAVKGALTNLGVKRVSELAEKDISSFLAALADA